ncbi:SRPBCC family protein [Corynebacterium sp. 335C]
MSDVPQDLSAELRIPAPADRVWDVVSDLRGMNRRSPQVLKTFIVGKPGAPVRKGSLMVNLNRQGAFVWPTTAKVVEWQPGRALAFRVTENKSTWRYELEPQDGAGEDGAAGSPSTLVRVTRTLRDGNTAVSRALVKYVLGRSRDFDERMAEGVEATLQEIARAVAAK